MPLQFAHSQVEMMKHLAAATDARAGGTASFIGSVRGENYGKAVSHLEYEAHEPLAKEMFLELEATAKKRFGIVSSHACHRLLRVDIGQPAVVIHSLALHRHQAFLATRFLIDELKRRLPIWKKEVYSDETASFGHDLCHHGEHDKKAQELIFSPPQKALQAMGIELSHLAKKKVVLVGAGGLGCPLAVNLAALSVNLTIVDGDCVLLSNIARQYAYRGMDEGRGKADLLQQFIEERSGFSRTEAISQFLDDELFHAIALDADLIVDATDDRATKDLLKCLAYKHRRPLITASVHQHDGEVQVYTPTHPGCLLCYSRDVRGAHQSCNQLGALTHICQLVAAIASDRALLLLAGMHVHGHELTIVDPRRGLQRLAIAQDVACHYCGNVKILNKPLVSIMRHR